MGNDLGLLEEFKQGWYLMREGELAYICPPPSILGEAKNNGLCGYRPNAHPELYGDYSTSHWQKNGRSWEVVTPEGFMKPHRHDLVKYLGEELPIEFSACFKK